MTITSQNANHSPVVPLELSDGENLTRENADHLIGALLLSQETGSVAGNDIHIIADNSGEVSAPFIDQLMTSLLTDLQAASLTVVNASSVLNHTAKVCAEIRGYPHRVQCSQTITDLTAPRTVPSGLFAKHLAHYIASHRSESSIEQSIADVFADNLPNIIQDDLIHHWAKETAALILADRCYDNEQDQALRAVRWLVAAHFPAAMTIRGSWIDGETLQGPEEKFTLTGHYCPRCATNPECYGAGIIARRCLDTVGCGWRETVF